MKHVLCLITAGGAGQDALRARHLAAGLEGEMTFFAIDKSLPCRETGRAIRSLLRSRPWDLVYQEGTGIASGLSLIQAARARPLKYVVSSGDPISGFFHVTQGPLHGYAFDLYERLLYRHCAGFVGWTPYLTGRALQLGARRAATVEGGVDLDLFTPPSPAGRLAARRRFGLAPDHLVCGVVGSLRWTSRQSYCYGLELVEVLKRVARPDLSMMIVGDGDGQARLERQVSDGLRGRIVFTGRLPQEDVVQAMQAMDIGFITQTLDALGNYRLTTKLPEYLACGLPVAMSPIPGFYDYAADAGWALPAAHPASARFHAECAAWLDGLGHAEVAAKAAQARPIACRRFDYRALGDRFCLFAESL